MVVSRLFVAFIVCLVILPSLNDVRQAHCYASGDEGEYGHTIRGQGIPLYDCIVRNRCVLCPSLTRMLP